jgi:hypothetical protein
MLKTVGILEDEREKIERKGCKGEDEGCLDV